VPSLPLRSCRKFVGIYPKRRDSIRTTEPTTSLTQGDTFQSMSSFEVSSGDRWRPRSRPRKTRTHDGQLLEASAAAGSSLMVIIVVLGMLFSMFAGRLAIAARLGLHVTIVVSTPQAARKRRGHRRDHKDRPNGRLRRNHAHTHCNCSPSLVNRTVPSAPIAR
jgi:hypothetical protein